MPPPSVIRERGVVYVETSKEVTMSRSGSCLAAALVLLFLLGCSGEREGKEPGRIPVGGEPILVTMLQRALHGAEPDGAVLVVLWTIQHPPTLELQDVTKRWSPHGLVALGVCVESLAEPPRETALRRIRIWQRRGRPGIPGLVFDGDAASLARAIPAARPVPGLILLDAQGSRIWSEDGFGEIDGLEGILRAHLGEPNVAGGGGPACGWTVSAAARAEPAAGPRPRAS
jgi:hypothetical protein